MPTDDEVQAEAAYGRVTCLRCWRFTDAGVCRAKSTIDYPYTPLEYMPALLWRRCDDFRPTSATTTARTDR